MNQENLRLVDRYSVWKLERYSQRAVRLFKHRVHQQFGRENKQRIRRLEY